MRKAPGRRVGSIRRAIPRRAMLLALWIIPVAGCPLPATPITPDPNVRFIAFGDSTTRGPAGADYPEMLRERLGEPEGSFANEGLGGETTAEGLARLTTLLDRAIYPNARTLLYWEGGNDVADFIRSHDPLLLFSPDDPGFPFADVLADSLEETRANIEAAVRLARTQGLDVFAATYYPILADTPECDPLPFNVLLPEQAERANVYVDRLNETIREAAAEAGALVVDVAARGSLLAEDPSNYFNCNHLSAQGNELVASIFAAALKGANTLVLP